jgi:hypothetical protein
MKFKKGDVVKLINNRQLSARIGATAFIERQDERYVYVKWIQGHIGQMNGAYNKEDFVLIPLRQKPLSVRQLNLRALNVCKKKPTTNHY